MRTSCPRRSSFPDPRRERSPTRAGIRIDLTEGHTEEDYPEDDPRQGGYQVFLFLNEILYEMLVAAGAPEEDDLDPLEGG